MRIKLQRLVFLWTLAMGSLQSLAAGAEPVARIPVFQSGARILFQGDSITDGNRGRSPDPNHILGHGYAFIIAAKFGAAFPDRRLTFLNRGVSGNKVTDLANRWQKDTIELKPDILSILIGVNDESAQVPVDEFEQGYDNLLKAVKSANPNIRLVLCAPFSLPVGGLKANFDAWNAAMKKRQKAVERLAKNHHAALVNFQPVFEAACKKASAEYWMWDGIHPTYSGHQLMADEWIKTVRNFWPKP